MPTVFIVDDDRTTSKLLQTLLELDGFQVVTVLRGSDVLTKARQLPPDIFLIDYNLADTDGIEVIRALRGDTHFSRTPIVMTSGMDVEHEAVDAGATCFIVKPFDPDALSQRLKEML